MEARSRKINKPSIAFGLVLLFLTLVALLLRVTSLDLRPMHADESVHTVKFRELWETGKYRYDPNEYHGPTIYYAALPVVQLRQRADFAATQESDYRLPVALFGAAMALFLPLVLPCLGQRAVLFAAAFLAVSPAFVFYARYYIQETVFVFFTLGLLVCGWRFLRSPSPGWAVATGACAGLMIATKETAILTFAAILIALLLTGRLAPLWRTRHLATALLTGLLVATIILSGFFTNLLAPLDYLKSFTPWLHRAGGTDLHQHPWHYYLQLLLGAPPRKANPGVSEMLIVLPALLATGAAFYQRGRWLRSEQRGVTHFLACFTLLLLGGYSAIPYKTPWCVLSALLGMVLLAAIGIDLLLRVIPGKLLKSLTGLLLLVGICYLGWQSYYTSVIAYNDLNNPYVYSPTAPETAELPQKVAPLAKVSPDGDNIVLQVLSQDGYYWPLPWYLRQYPHVGYWTGVPAQVDAPIILSSSAFDEELTRRLDKTHLMTGYFALRPGVLMQIWVRLDLWEKYIATLPPDRDT